MSLHAAFLPVVSRIQDIASPDHVAAAALSLLPHAAIEDPAAAWSTPVAFQQHCVNGAAQRPVGWQVDPEHVPAQTFSSRLEPSTAAAW